jgi:hypothetical protein
MKGKKLFLYSLTSLAAIASSAVSAEEFASAPSLEGGWSGMIGGFWFVPSNDNTTYAQSTSFSSGGHEDTQYFNTDGKYKLGWQAAIGYVFDNTANGIELSFRDYSSHSDSSTDVFDPAYYQTHDFDSQNASSNQGTKFQDWDLMVSQFLDIGTHVQMRFLGGISYLAKLEQNTTSNYDFSELITGDLPTYTLYENYTNESNSHYSGVGPRIGADARYDFGDGFGIVGGFSVAYFLGELENNANDYHTESRSDLPGEHLVYDDTFNNDIDNHAVTNLRANLGVDYVYFFEDQDLPTLGLELGYEVDTYLSGIGNYNAAESTGVITASDVTFSGPYLNLKGVF